MSETAKKRKRDGQEDPVALAAEGGETRAMLAQTLSKMEKMQTQMNAMTERVARMGELEDKCHTLDNRCNHLEARTGSLERTLRSVVTHKGKWKYSAIIPPLADWINLGFDEEYANHVREFLSRIEATTNGLRSGRFHRRHDHDIFLDGDLNGDDSTLVLPHDESFLDRDRVPLVTRHWRELADALQLLPNDVSCAFSIYNVQLPSEVLNLLAPALKGKRLTHFELCRNDFPNISDGIDFAIQVMKDTPGLSTFSWENFPINNPEDVLRLGRAVSSQPFDGYLRMKGCCGPDVNGYALLRSILSGRVSESGCCLWMNFSSNNIRTNGSHIPAFIEANTKLRSLSLEENHLDDRDAISIAKALKQNTNLLNLRLLGNDITDDGCRALLDAVFDSRSLNSAAASNHTCQIDCLRQLGEDPPNGSLLLRENRAEKIHRMLTSRNRERSNVHYLDEEFGDDALKVAPNVLWCVQLYASYRDRERNRDTSLSILYEIMRGWKMPQLYERQRLPIMIE